MKTSLVPSLPTVVTTRGPGSARSAIVAALLLIILHFPPLFADDHNPVGVTGTFEGLSTTGGAYNVLNHNATRQIDDIVVPGSIGKYPLKMTRYYNSRSDGSMCAGWSHEYLWGGSPSFDKVTHPNGDVWDSHCISDWGNLGGPVGVSEWRTTWNGFPAFRLADGGTVVFENSTFHVATKIIDPYGQITTISLDSNGLITYVTEPGGRYLQFTYTQVNGWWLLTEVDAYNAQGNYIEQVVYHYASEPTGGTIVPSAMCLTQVDYSDGTHAYYTYTTDNQPEHAGPGVQCPCTIKQFPLVLTCDDRRYHGPMRRIAYEYEPDGGAHGAIVKERYWDGVGAWNSGAVVSQIIPAEPSPLSSSPDFPTACTEYRGDGHSRTFNYTPLRVIRSGNPDQDICPGINGPAPEQFLLNYTDFQGHTTYLGYDGNWYVNSVQDANIHTTTYQRGPPPNAYPGPKGIGQILQIKHPDNTHIDYTYYDESPNISGHYVQTVSDERGKVTTYTRNDPNNPHVVTRIDYPQDVNTPASSEVFTYNNFGQVTNASAEKRRLGEFCLRRSRLAHRQVQSEGDYPRRE